MLQIRRYRSTDHATIRELFILVNRELAPSHLHEAFKAYIALSLREEIDCIAEYYDEGRGRSFWVAVIDNVLAGCFGLEPTVQGAIEIRRMYVQPLYRRQGVATAMLRHAEAVCQERGTIKLLLSTSELQCAALGLYSSAGYRLLGEEHAVVASNKTVGHGIRRFHFEKVLAIYSP